MAMTRDCYRQTVAYRYLFISILAITVVVLISLNEGVKHYSISQHWKTQSPKVYDIRDEEGAYPKKSFPPNRDDHGDPAPNTPGTCVSPGQEPSKIILLAYGRSGSSMTGDILSQHPGVFYHYEPLKKLATSFKKRMQAFQHKHKQLSLTLTGIRGYNVEAERVLYQLMTCNYTHLPSTSYTSQNLIRSKSTRPLQRCIHLSQNDKRKIHECLLVNSKRCKTNPIQVIKTIRLTAQSVGNLMSRLPTLKVVYLIRDPRGRYMSRIKAFSSFPSKNVTYDASRFCRRFLKDIETIQELRHRFPGRVHITRYETIAENPVEMSRKLYDFLCLDYSHDIQKYVKETIMGGNDQTDRKLYSVRRKDPKASSYAWRSKMSFEQANSFDRLCSDAYTKVGYLPVSSREELADFNTPLKESVEFML